MKKPKVSIKSNSNQFEQKKEEFKRKFDKVLLLTPAEMDIFSALGHGMVNKEVANIAGAARSMKTVDTHKANMRKKLGAGSNYMLIHMASIYNYGCGLFDLGTVSVSATRPIARQAFVESRS